MRTHLQDRRLRKLICFLEKLPRSKFGFSREVSGASKNSHWCPTVACAIGWVPKIFPRLVRWEFNANGSFINFVLNGGQIVNYREVGEFLFGVPRRDDIFYPNGSCNSGELKDFDVNVCDYGATPKQVATMLRLYRKAVPAQIGNETEKIEWNGLTLFISPSVLISQEQ